MPGMAFTCSCGAELVVVVPAALIIPGMDPEEGALIDLATMQNALMEAEADGGFVVDGRAGVAFCWACLGPIDLHELAGLSILREAVA